MIERFEKFSFAISELYHYLHKLTRKEMKKYGLGGPHAIYFFVLYRNEKGLTSTNLSKLTFRNKADVSRAIALFEEKGLITKKGGTKNSYRAKIVLTESGLAAAKGLVERAEIVITNVGKGLSDENRDIFYNSLDIISSNLKDFCKKSESKQKDTAK